jgi:hypothetical protein
MQIHVWSDEPVAAGRRPSGLSRMSRPGRRGATVVESVDEGVAGIVLLGGLVVLLVVGLRIRRRDA